MGRSACGCVCDCQASYRKKYVRDLLTCLLTYFFTCCACPLSSHPCMRNPGPSPARPPCLGRPSPPPPASTIPWASNTHTSRLQWSIWLPRPPRRLRLPFRMRPRLPRRLRLLLPRLRLPPLRLLIEPAASRLCHCQCVSGILFETGPQTSPVSLSAS